METISDPSEPGGPCARCHRSGFAFYWRAISNTPRLAGRKRISKEIRDLIYQVVRENPTRGAPRFHGELLMLGVDISRKNDFPLDAATAGRSRASQTLARLSGPSSRSNRRDGLFHRATITFVAPHCFFIIARARRPLLHFNVTKHPTGQWIVRQLRQALRLQSARGFSSSTVMASIEGRFPQQLDLSRSL
jgi:hypothetical protein